MDKKKSPEVHGGFPGTRGPSFSRTAARLRRSLAAHPTRYAPSAFKRPETPVSATV